MTARGQRERTFKKPGISSVVSAPMHVSARSREINREEPVRAIEPF